MNDYLMTGSLPVAQVPPTVFPVSVQTLMHDCLSALRHDCVYTLRLLAACAYMASPLRCICGANPQRHVFNCQTLWHVLTWQNLIDAYTPCLRMSAVFVEQYTYAMTASIARNKLYNSLESVS